MRSNSNPFQIEQALEYAERFKWPVLPLHYPTKDGCSCHKPDCKQAGKHPMFHKNDMAHGCHSASTDPKVIRRWFARWPWANVGIATGEQSFDVLDVDISDVENGNDTLDDLQAKYGRLPDTVEQITGSGGRQILFMHDNRIDNSVRFAPGLDTRSAGGLVVVPSSLHASGRRYQWELSSLPGEVTLAAWPSWLVKIIQESSGAANGVSKNPPGWQNELLKGVTKGNRHKAIIKLTGHYLNRGFKPVEIYYLLVGWNTRNDPPVSAQEISKQVKSIAERHAKGNIGETTNAKRISISIG